MTQLGKPEENPAITIEPLEDPVRREAPVETPEIETPELVPA